MRFLAVILSLVLFAPMLAHAGKTEELAADFESGNRLYEEGKFTEAAAVFAGMAKSNAVSPALLFNLGNAYFKSGEMGAAIRTYLEAHRWSPRDPDLQANLRFARDQVEGERWRDPRWQVWLAQLSANEWAVVWGASLWLLLGLLSACQFRPNWYRPLKIWIAAAALFMVAVGTCLGLAVGLDPLKDRAVIHVPESTVRNGPFEESQGSFFLRNGAEVRVVDEKDGWLRIKVDDRKSGWVQSKDVLRVGRE